MSSNGLWAGYDTGKDNCKCPDSATGIFNEKGCDCSGGITALAPVREPLTASLTGAKTANTSAFSLFESPLFLIGAVAVGLWIFSSMGEPEKGSKK